MNVIVRIQISRSYFKVLQRHLISNIIKIVKILITPTIEEVKREARAMNRSVINLHVSNFIQLSLENFFRSISQGNRAEVEREEVQVARAMNRSVINLHVSNFIQLSLDILIKDTKIITKNIIPCQEATKRYKRIRDRGSV